MKLTYGKAKHFAHKCLLCPSFGNVLLQFDVCGSNTLVIISEKYKEYGHMYSHFTVCMYALLRCCQHCINALPK